MENQPTIWQQQLAEGFSNIEELCRYLEIDSQQLPLLHQYKAFPLKVTRSYVDCMQKGNPDDPLLRQILPLQAELIESADYKADPVGDLAAITTPGVIHKYQGRVLLILTGACAIHCRYCFRRNFPYAELQVSKQKLTAALSYIQDRSDISEVIFSGGDPLLLTDSKLKTLVEQIAQIPHIKRIRIHSRLPIVLPSRITPELLDLLKDSNKQIIMVVHCNHAHELSEAVNQACLQMSDIGICLLNQSVLLNGVNDNADTLCQLQESLFKIKILPYYLHMLDKVSGATHFAVSDEKAAKLLKNMRERLPGYLVPKLVREQAGAAFKIPIMA